MSGFQEEITVLVSTFNHENFIRECINSVLNQQTSVPFRVIIRDDCSTDNTRMVLQEYNGDPRVKLVFEEENQFQLGVRPVAALLRHVQRGYFAVCFEC